MVNRSFASLLSRMYAASSPLNRVLIGTSVAPAESVPSAATIHSHTFGAQIATRSPPSIPAAAIAEPASRTRPASSPKVIVASSSTTARRSSNRSAASSTSRGIVPHRTSPRSTIEERLHDLGEPVHLLEHDVAGAVREPQHRLTHTERGEVLDPPGVGHRAERLHLHGVRVAAELLVRAPELRERGLDPPPPDGHPAVRVLRDRREQLRAAGAAHEDRRPRLLHGLRPRPARFERHELPVERRLVVGPEPLHRKDLLACDVAPALEVQTVVLDLVPVPPETHAERHAATGQQVERRNLFRRDDGIALGDEEDGGPQAEPFRGRRRRRQRDERVERVPVVLRQRLPHRCRGPPAHRDVGVLRDVHRREPACLGLARRLGRADRPVGQEHGDAEPHRATTSRNGSSRSGCGSRGRPSTRSAIRLRWMSSVPPPMWNASDPRNARCTPSSPASCPSGPRRSTPSSAEDDTRSASTSFMIDPSAVGICPRPSLLTILACRSSRMRFQVYTRTSRSRAIGPTPRSVARAASRSNGIANPLVAPPSETRSFMSVVTATFHPSPGSPSRSACGTRTPERKTSLKCAEPSICRSGR